MDALPAAVVPQCMAVVATSPHSLVESPHHILPVLLLQPLQKVARPLIPGVPLAVRVSLPVRWRIARLQSHPVCHALGQPYRRSPKRAVLPAMHHFVHQNPHDLVFLPRLGHLRNVSRVEVDFLVVVVQGKAGCVGHAVHFAQDQGDGSGAWNKRLLDPGVEVFEDGVDGVVERVRGVYEAQEGVGAF